MKCANCNADNLPDAQVCANCGEDLPQPLATRGSRLWAAILDAFVIVIPFAILALVGQISLALIWAGAVTVIQFALLTRYGQTVGKKANGIHIEKIATGENGGFVTNVLLRLVVNTLLAIIPGYALVDILFIFRNDRRCIHDFIAGTQVVKTDPSRRERVSGGVDRRHFVGSASSRSRISRHMN